MVTPRFCRPVLSLLLSLCLLAVMAPAAAASAPPELQSVDGGGPGGTTLVTRWDSSIETADAGQFQVWDTAETPALVATATGATIDSGDASRVTLDLNAALVDGQDYALVVLADGVNDGAAGNLETPPAAFTADTEAPSALMGEVDGSVLTITFDEALDEDSVPDAGDFTVSLDGTGAADVSDVAVTDDQVVLTLADAVADDAEVAVGYTIGTNPLRDPATNEVEAITGLAVTNLTDSTSPQLQSAVVDGTALVLTYDEALDESSTPANGAFDLTVDGSPGDVTGVSVTGDEVLLTVAEVTAGQEVTLAYTAADAEGMPIQDLAGNDAADLAGEAVTNAAGSPPELVTAELDGDVLTLIYSEDLDEASVPAGTDFEVLVDAVAIGVDGVTITADTVTLTLGASAMAGADVTLSYTPGESPILDLDGDPAAALAEAAVANVTDGVAAISGVPLDVRIGDDLSCGLRYDDRQLLFGDSGETASCGTFLYADGQLYGPPVGPAAQPFSPVSQTAVTGDGTSEDPFTVTTVVTAGEAGLRLTQTDTYADGEERTTSTITVENTGESAVPVVLYRAADCMVDGNDFGYGGVVAETGAVRCLPADDEGAQGDGYLEFTPVTAGAHYEAGYDEVWTALEAGEELANVCRCDELIDNGMGVSWAAEIPAGDAASYTVDTAAALPVDDIPPMLVSGDVDGDDVTLYYDEGLDGEAVPDGSAWTIAGSESGSLEVTSVLVDDDRVELTLSSLVTAAEEVLLDYDDSAVPAIQDPAGNPAGALSGVALANESAPELAGGMVIDSEIDLFYDEALDDTSVPAPEAFEVTVDGETATVEDVEIIGETGDVFLFLTEPVEAGQVVTVGYTVPETGMLRDLDAHVAAGVTGFEPDNLTGAGELQCEPAAVNSSLENIGFETGTLDGWTEGVVVDDIEAAEADSFTSPWEGQWMARLGSTYASDEENQVPGPNELCQDFVVTQATERFSYQIFTYDYSGFDRFRFQLLVTDPDTGEVLADHQQDAWGTTGDTSLKSSGWQGVTLDLSEHVGETVRLSFSAGGTSDQLFGFWAYLDSAEEGLPTPVTPIAAPGSETGSVVTDPQTGKVTVSMPFSEPSDLTLTTTVACEGVLGDVVMFLQGEAFTMAAVDGQPGTFTVTIPAEQIVEVVTGQADLAATLALSAECDGVEVVNQVGSLVLYDPSGTVTDGVTGEPVVGAEVTLFKVPGWVAKDEDGNGDCESNESKPAGQPWSQPAPADLGQRVSAASPEISPNVNPFVTNAVGYYGWDVAAGCWFVTVEKDGYEVLTSPVVGVPPEVTDLDLALTPLSEDEDQNGGGSGGGGGGGRSTTVPAGGVSREVSPNASGRAHVALAMPGGPVTVSLEGLRGAGVLTVRPRSTSPVPSEEYVAIGNGVDLTLTGAQFQQATVCLPQDAGGLAFSGATASEVRLLHQDGTGIHDITTSADHDEVCGRADRFSAFALAVARSGRIGGSDRVATAAAVSAARFPAGTSTVYLTTAEDFADALAAGPSAARHDAPLLLTRGRELPAATLAEIERLGAGTVTVVGGAGAVPPSVAGGLQALGVNVRRISGGDRYATTAAVSADTYRPGVREVFVATGENFPDALAGGAAAARRGAPVLLVTRDMVPSVVAAELSRLQPRAITVLGGPAAVSDAVAAELAAFTTGPVTRVAGPDRYATAAAVTARYFRGSGGTVFVATGVTFADALAGVPAAALTGSPLLLVDADRIPQPIRAELRRLAAARVLVLGRGAAVSDAVGEEVGGLVG